MPPPSADAPSNVFEAIFFSNKFPLGHRQRQNVKQRRPSQRRNNFESEYDDEFEDDDDDEEEEERRYVVGNYKPTFRRTSHERESGLKIGSKMFVDIF